MQTGFKIEWEGEGEGKGDKENWLFIDACFQVKSRDWRSDKSAQSSKGSCSLAHLIVACMMNMFQS